MSKVHRIEFIGKIPHQCYLALSGGPDSMAILDFLIKGGRDIIALHYNHGTEHAQEAETFVRGYCQDNRIPLEVGNISYFREKTSGESPEEYWRNARYDFFKEFSERNIIMAHNLDDEVENFLFTSIRNGAYSLIPYRRKMYDAVIIRPFILTRKATLEWWCQNKNVPFVIDPGNADPKHTRSFIRHSLLPKALVVNPGLYTVIKKKVRYEA